MMPLNPEPLDLAPFDLPMMSRPAITLHLNCSIAEAASLLREENVGCILITDSQKRVVGVLTDRDIVCEAVALDRDLERPVSDIMSPRPILASPKDSRAHLIELMIEYRIRRIPIVEEAGNENEKILGIVTLDDLIIERQIPLEILAEIVQRQLQKQIVTGTTREGIVSATAHSERSLNRFYQVISQRTRIAPEQLVELTRFLLGAVVRRLHYTGAARFTNQLPPELREELLDMPAGPDRSITVSSLWTGLSARFKLDEESARAVVLDFFASLEELLPKEELKQLKLQLPEDFQGLFTGARPDTGKHGQVA